MERRRVRGASPEIGARARQLRHAPTKAEDLLWNGLRGWNIGKFRRQHPFERFILDFYCPAAKLCVEVDGDVHDEQVERDAARTEILNTHGIRVIRFRNEEVLGDMRSVLRRIEAVLKNR
jgi:very-short-patch-repair endonuclease